jgi:hypothetical protein
MALYHLQDFQELVASSKWCCLNKRRAFRTLDKLGWSDDDLAKMLCSMRPNDFQKIVPKCKVNDFPGEDYVDADQYEVHWNEEVAASCGNLMDATVSLSLKIAIVTGLDGQKAGVVTFHISGTFD